MHIQDLNRVLEAQRDPHGDILTAIHKTNPKFAEYLQGKYEAEKVEFEKAIAENVPSTKVRYWAKTSCNKCLGKGTITVNGTDHICKCVDKNYFKWFEKFRTEYYKRDNT